MIELPDVTLCCIDSANHRLALRALERSRRGIRFGRTLFLTSGLSEAIVVPDDIELVPIPSIASRDAYSQFVLKSLGSYISTGHVLLVQWDGHVINPESWDERFLDWDYIGAQWFWHKDGMKVGNGGFSLRSRRLLAAVDDPRITLSPNGAEDETICRRFRPLLEGEYGIRFAPESVADRFSFEAAYPTGRPFGFHGLYNFCRVLGEDEIVSLVDSFSDPIAVSPQLDQLLRNCLALQQWKAASAIARRILASQPTNLELQQLLRQANAGATQSPVRNRNDPCPCGSGKRYKHCHGTMGPIAATSPPPSPDDLVGRGMQAHQRGDLASAEQAYRAALEINPQHPYALHYLGVIRYQSERISEALPLLEQAVALVPHESEFHNNLGLALLASDRSVEAIAAHREALRLAPGNLTAANNLGLALQEANDLPGAIAAYRQALAGAAEFARAHWNLGLALLANGEFEEGWREYEWRLAIPELGQLGQLPASKRWDGSALAGQTILLTAEQGLGDALQFVRFARLLADRGARVVVQTQPPLTQLLRTAPGVAAAISTADSLPTFDRHLPLLSVAGALGIQAATIPGAVPYIRPQPADVALAQQRVQPYRPNLLVGLSWAGNPRYSADRRRSCPLAALSPLLTTPGVTFFSLQRDDGEDQIPQVAAAAALVLLDDRRDFDRKAALVQVLDLVISVDTSHVHLAGALARPVWAMLPFSPDWRWRLTGAASPWYPTARLFRQSTPGDWAGLVAELRQALDVLLAGRC